MNAYFVWAVPPHRVRAGLSRALRAAAGAAALAALTSLGGCAQWNTVTSWKPWSGWFGKDTSAATATAAATPVVAAPPPGLQPTTETARWRGLYRYDEQGGSFAECRTGQKLPVLMEGDNALLESAYASTRPVGGAVSMLATVEGRLLDKAADDPVLARQGHKQLALRVDRFVELSSASSCRAGRSW